jgi:hypothetical protein
MAVRAGRTDTHPGTDAGVDVGGTFEGDGRTQCQIYIYGFF